MQRKTWYFILGLDAMPLSLKNLLLKTISLALEKIDHGGRAGETGAAIAPPILGRNRKSKPVPSKDLLLPCAPPNF